ncbi:hypothetical protein VT03_27855 [Planctomyces sp. SH-PL14]|nr:hypothetical protein VT03_27855 [Planctomyces sp. SH-PL14]
MLRFDSLNSSSSLTRSLTDTPVPEFFARQPLQAAQLRAHGVPSTGQARHSDSSHSLRDLDCDP